MSFEDIKDQDIPVSFLKKAIKKNSVAHAYLFVGMDGIGKALSANTFAKALNCEKETGDSCDVCASCRKIDSKNHPDIFRIACEEAHKAIKINAIRELEGKISLRPYEARYKVCIIEDAHLMTAEAANSLLKTLEEPPKDSVLILTTSGLSGLFKTILSRCQVIKFSPLKQGTIANILIKKFGFRKENTELMSRLAGGGINRKAILEGEDFVAWKNQVIDEFMDGSFFERGSLMFSSSRKEFQEILHILLNWHRDMIIYKNGLDKDTIINFDRVSDVERFSGGLSHDKIEERLNSLMDAYVASGQNVNQKLIIGALV